jgi:hypothetical protein
VVRKGIGCIKTMVRMGGSLATAVVAVMSLASPAYAGYEQAVEHFASSGEGAQLLVAGRRATATAVNSGGAGLPAGEAGSFYVVGESNVVLRYGPGKEGEEPPFREAWGWGVGNGDPEYQRCGPAYTTEPRPAHTFPVCTFPGFGAGEGVGQFAELAGVAVDETTGDVYVRNLAQSARLHHLIEVFTATGTPVGEGFGDQGREAPLPRESIAQGPEKLHELGTAAVGAIAVDGDGTVYLNDHDFNNIEGTSQARIMSFEPCAQGDYEHYCYASGKDILTTPRVITRLALVDGARIVAADEQVVREYSLSGPGTPICSFTVNGALKALTADPGTGEVIFFSSSDKKIHRLTACEAGTGLFHEAQELTPLPETKRMLGIALSPETSWAALRPRGVLYGIDSEEHGAQMGIGDVFVPAHLLPPEVKAESVTGTTASSTTLRAEVDPKGSEDSSFQFEYLSKAAYDANGGTFTGSLAAKAPLSPGKMSSTGQVVQVTASIAALSPHTIYVFRAVVCDGPHQELCGPPGGTAEFQTYAETPTGLPDDRAFELVSPAEKMGGEVFPADSRVGSCGEGADTCKPPGGLSTGVIFPMVSSADGDAVSYEGFPFYSSSGAAVYNSYVSRRLPAGWQTTAVSPASFRPGIGNEDLAFNDGLTEGVISQANPQLTPAAPLGYANLYLQQTADPTSFAPLVTSPPPNRSGGVFKIEYAGYAPDFSAQFFAANDALTAASPAAPEPPDPGQFGRDLYQWSGGILKLVNVLPGNLAVASGAAFASASPDAHAVSQDGRRVYWEAGGTVYVREDGQVTRAIKHGGSFLVASSSGLLVLLSDGCRYSLLTESCVDLTQGDGGFRGVVGQSSDLSTIYFVDTAKLPGAGKNAREQEAQVGQNNLYLWQENQVTHEGQVKFIATLLPSDNAAGSTKLADWVIEPGERTAEASPDGQWLAFGSTAELTGHHNVGPCAESGQVLVNVACTELFLYNAADGQLACPSCNPTGEAPLGNSTLRRINAAPAWLPQPHYLTNQGRLYFDSGDRLSPRDVNGRVEDVYESEPGGVGSCGVPEGCVQLISPGTGTVDSNLLAVDGTGANVFFTTRERLVPRDTDDLIDLYDAREGGGFREEGEISPKPCGGEACQGQQQVPREVPGPGTADFQGAGNPKPARSSCPKGKVKKQGHCVSPPSQKRKTKKHGRTKPNQKRGGHQ